MEATENVQLWIINNRDLTVGDRGGWWMCKYNIEAVYKKGRNRGNRVKCTGNSDARQFLQTGKNFIRSPNLSLINITLKGWFNVHMGQCKSLESSS